MPYPPVHRLVWIPSPFGTELPYGPIVAMFGVEESNEAVERVAVGTLGVGLAGAGAVQGMLAKLQRTKGLERKGEGGGGLRSEGARER